MRCPVCDTDTRVVDSRPVVEDNTIRRRRLCLNDRCSHRFTTIEGVSVLSAAVAEERKERPKAAMTSPAVQKKRRAASLDDLMPPAEDDDYLPEC